MTKLIVFFFSRKRPLVGGLLDASSRLITTLRPQDVICLPAGFPSIEDMWEESKRMFLYTDDQVVWYPVIASGHDEAAGDDTPPAHVVSDLPEQGSVLTAPTSEDWVRISHCHVDIEATMKAAMARLEENGHVHRQGARRSSAEGSEQPAASSQAVTSSMHDVIVERAYVDRDTDPVLAAMESSQWPVIVPMFVTETLRSVCRSMCVRLFGDAWESVVQKSWLHPHVPREAVAAEAERQARKDPSGGGAEDEEDEEEEEEDDGAGDEDALDVAGTRRAGGDDPLAEEDGEGDAEDSLAATPLDLPEAEPAGSLPVNTKDPDAEAAVIAASRGTFSAGMGGVPECAAQLPFLKRGVDIPRGYQCQTHVELLAAYRLLRKEGVTSILLKPSDGSSAGKGIEFGVKPARLAVYPFDRDAVVTLEEELPLARAADGSVLTPVYHYLGGKPIMGPMEQIIFGASSFGGNVHPPTLPAAVIARTKEITAGLQQHLGYQGWWGLDMLVHAESGRPLLTDLNTGRPNGGHRPALFAGLRAPATDHFRCWRQVMPPVSVSEFMRRLRARGLAFGQADGEASGDSFGARLPARQQRGLMPLMYLPSRQSHLIMLGSDKEDLQRLLQQWEAAEKDILE